MNQTNKQTKCSTIVFGPFECKKSVCQLVRTLYENLKFIMISSRHSYVWHTITNGRKKWLKIETTQCSSACYYLCLFLYSSGVNKKKMFFFFSFISQMHELVKLVLNMFCCCLFINFIPFAIGFVCWLTSSKNTCVLRRICRNSVSSK